MDKSVEASGIAGGSKAQLSAVGPLDVGSHTRYQIVIIAFTVCIAALDGFDAFSMAFVAPVVGREWELNVSVLGLLLSSGFVGMAMGSFLLSSAADFYGRKPVILCSLTVMTVGSLLSAISQSVAMLALSRVVTGIGLGAIVSLTIAISAEFSGAAYRAFMVALVAQGFPLGNILGGLVSAGLLASLGWRWVFLTGAFAGACLLILLSLFFLESPSYLAAQQTPDALLELNKVLRKLGHAQLSELPCRSQRIPVSYRALFVSELANVTIILALVDVLLVTAGFFLLSWLPQFVASSGFTPASASIVAALTASCGVVGGLLVGALALRIGAPRVAATSMVATGLAISALGVMPPGLLSLSFAAGVFGFFFAGSTGVLYSLMAAAFPPLARTSAVGFILGAGRVAGAAGPALAGWMFAAGAARWQVTTIFAAGPIAAGIILGATNLKKGSRDV